MSIKPRYEVINVHGAWGIVRITTNLGLLCGLLGSGRTTLDERQLLAGTFKTRKAANKWCAALREADQAPAEP